MTVAALRSFLLALASGVALAACGEGDNAPGGEGQVNLYTARPHDGDQALYDRFTRETGIRVNVIAGDADALIARMRGEGEASAADLFVAADAGALHRAEQAGLFQPIRSETIEQRIPANLREPSGLWTGFMRHVRAVAYDSNRVREDEVERYEQLASPRFRRKLCAGSADDGHTRSLVGALVEVWGPERTLGWARGIVANMARAPQGDDRAQIHAVNAGLCEIALTDSHHYIRMASGDDAAERAMTEKVQLGFPSLGGQGSHIDVSGGGVVANAPHRDNAIRLLEFLTDPATQEDISADTREYPASPTVTAPPRVASYTGFQPHPMPVANVAKREAEAQRIMTAAGWR